MMKLFSFGALALFANAQSGNPNPGSIPPAAPVLGVEYDDPLNIPDVGKTFIIRNVKHRSHRLAFNPRMNPNTYFFDGDIYDDQFWTLEQCTAQENLGLGADPLLLGCLGYFYLRNDRHRDSRLVSNLQYGTYAYWEGPYYDQLWKFERVRDGQYYIINVSTGCRLYTHGNNGNTIGCFEGAHNDDQVFVLSAMNSYQNTEHEVAVQNTRCDDTSIATTLNGGCGRSEGVPPSAQNQYCGFLVGNLDTCGYIAQLLQLELGNSIMGYSWNPYDKRCWMCHNYDVVHPGLQGRMGYILPKRPEHKSCGKAFGAVAADNVRLIDASQSSTSEDQQVAELALDRNPATFSHTLIKDFVAAGEWWQASFKEGLTAVRLVRVYSRQDCCGNRLDGAKVTINDQLCGYLPKNIGNGQWVDVPCETTLIGTNVRVTMEIDNVLHIAMIEVYKDSTRILDAALDAVNAVIGSGDPSSSGNPYAAVNEAWDCAMGQFNALKDAWNQEETRLNSVYSAAEVQLEQRAKEIASLFSQNVVDMNTGATRGCNRRRRNRRNRRKRRGIRPQSLSVNRTKKAQGFFDGLTCVTQGNTMVCTAGSGTNLMDMFNGSGQRSGRRLQEADPDAVQDGCYQAIWENKDSSVETNADNAVEAWMSYEEHLDKETFKPKEGKEAEVFAFLNVINDAGEDTEIEVAYAVKENFVMGVFCPAAITEPEYLKLNMPVVDEPPTPIPIPEGMDIQLSADSACPETAAGGRPNCAANLCCGRSVKDGDDATFTETCRPESEGIYEKDGINWSFTCLDAKMLVGSVIGMISVAFFQF